jgi:hypothetical protein
MREGPMRAAACITIILAAGALVCAVGCKRNEKPSEWNTVGSVRVSMPELQQAFQNSTAPEIQSRLNEAALALRYGQYPKVVAALEKLASTPGLTPQQQKLTGEVIGQVKQLALKAQSK